MKITLPRLNLDWMMGVVAAIPYAYPKEPLYFGAFFVLILFLPRIRLNSEGQETLFWLSIFAASVCLSNIFSSYADFVYPFSVFGTLFSVIFFLVRFGVRDFHSFVRGFLFVICIYIILTFVYFLLLRPFEHGLIFFTDSQMRMWGEGYLIEWPNVFCVFLVIGGFLFWIRKQYIWMVLSFFAAVLTTSRMALLALALLIIYIILKNSSLKSFLYGLLVLVVGFSSYIFVNSDEQFTEYVMSRLLKTEDRFLIYNDLVDTFSENFFGIGNVGFSFINDMYVSYHSSFLKVLVRNGFIGLIAFVFIVMPKRPIAYLSLKESIPLIFLLGVGVVQDMLFHIHLIIVYSVLLGLRNEKIRVNFSRER